MSHPKISIQNTDYEETIPISKSIENQEPKKTQQKTDQKTYLNLYCCKLSVGIIFTYIFILCSITINIVNRVIFLKYHFKFNVTLIFLQQVFCLLFFLTVSKTSKAFKEQAGDISFKDFYALKFQYIGFSLFFIVRTITSFLGYQLVTNIPMYVNLRKFLTTMTFMYECFWKKTKMNNTNILVVILLTLGTILAGIDDYTTDYKGYLTVLMKNTLNLINLQISENFKKKNGVSNLKLLVYNSFLSTPILFFSIFLIGEHRKLGEYLSEKHNFSYGSLGYNLLISCAVVCFTNSSFFISNEKNTSLITQLLSDSKYIFITILSYIYLKSFSFTWKNILGLLISTSAAVIITIKTLYDNIQIKKNKTTPVPRADETSELKNVMRV